MMFQTMGIFLGSQSFLERAEHRRSGYDETPYPTHLNADTRTDVLARSPPRFNIVGLVSRMAVELPEADFTGLGLATRPSTQHDLNPIQDNPGYALLLYCANTV